MGFAAREPRRQARDASGRPTRAWGCRRSASESRPSRRPTSRPKRVGSGRLLSADGRCVGSMSWPRCRLLPIMLGGLGGGGGGARFRWTDGSDISSCPHDADQMECHLTWPGTAAGSLRCIISCHAVLYHMPYCIMCAMLCHIKSVLHRMRPGDRAGRPGPATCRSHLRSPGS